MNADVGLAALRDIRLPPEPGLWPPAPGWWLVAGLLLALAAAAMLRRRSRRQPLRSALRELDALAAAHALEGDPVRLARGVSRLLRRYALERFDDPRIGGLTRRDWLAFLDRNGGGGAFGDGPGRLLETLPYRPERKVGGPSPSNTDPAELVALARRWLEANAP